jgi:hypothetical protein
MRPKLPSGPLLHRNIDTQSPITTGGNAIPVLMKLKRQPRPENLLIANHVPKGKPMTRLMAIAVPDTWRVNKVIAQISGSPLIMSRNASFIPSQITSMN